MYQLVRIKGDLWQEVSVVRKHLEACSGRQVSFSEALRVWGGRKGKRFPVAVAVVKRRRVVRVNVFDGLGKSVRDLDFGGLVESG